MATSYVKPEPNERVYAILRQVMREHHHRLRDAGVRVGVLFAAIEDGPALKVGGRPTHVDVRVVPLMWRMLCDFDALMLIDAREWEAMEDDTQFALIDHGLSAIDTVEKDGPGESVLLSRDDIGRPKLQAVKPDWQGGPGYVGSAKRNGPASIEYMNARRVWSKAEAARIAAEAEAEPEPAAA